MLFTVFVCLIVIIHQIVGIKLKVH